MRSTLEEIARETQIFAGIVGALWFACYLYELGFMARFGVPPIVADIGFSLPLAVAVTAGTLGALATALVLFPRLRFAGGPSTGEISGAVWGVAVVAFVLASILLEDPGFAVVTAPPSAIELHPIKLLLSISLAIYAAMFFAKLYALGRRHDYAAIGQLSLLTVLLILAPVGLGWFGAEKKIENKRSFFYLAERPDYVLVRLYDDKAVFVRYDPKSGAFSSDYLIHLLDDPDRALVTRKPSTS